MCVCVCVCVLHSVLCVCVCVCVSHFMTLASSMKSSSFMAPSFIILMATSIFPFHLPATTLCSVCVCACVCVCVCVCVRGCEGVKM